MANYRVRVASYVKDSLEYLSSPHRRYRPAPQTLGQQRPPEPIPDRQVYRRQASSLEAHAGPRLTTR